MGEGTVLVPAPVTTPKITAGTCCYPRGNSLSFLVPLTLLASVNSLSLPTSSSGPSGVILVPMGTMTGTWVAYLSPLQTLLS